MKCLIMVLFLITGCGLSAEQKQEMITTGELRHELFVECMGLSASIERQGDDDVSDIIDECDTVSFYMSNSMTN